MISVSGFLQAEHKTNLAINTSRRSWSLGASWAPLTMYLSEASEIDVWAPNSKPKNLITYEGGRDNALATSEVLTTAVRIPLPLPSILEISRGILYR
ncbi:hypothetical protein AWJ20_721 [Sugiyamaella lignohabitans]|uniref:Uncharacterized protein n=1 Tax=Sugiyamaella lignohabitans TaxID=796027 RepID=A0A167D4I0_9ASCO|nr:uncharacterized protein AWJ20_721 [Sugiyamaella lignohabitans]ANB12466.1 hypothetical protein AWJ20_721 [Sugiyamaella lignohabitans]